jgi:hypothetical protein
MQLVQTLDGYGKPAWIAAMVLGFILWWPLGLGILAYTIWSERMGCGWRRDFRDTEFGREVMRWRRGFPQFRSSGNRVFDEYREETLRRVEEEVNEFRDFLKRLRKAKDKAEFDQFMAERHGGAATSA